MTFRIENLGTYLVYGDMQVDITLEEIEPAKPPPELPPPVWDNRVIDPDRAMEAVRAMCG